MNQQESEPVPLLIGWASRSITPEKPVQLAGQFHERISERVRDPVMATALALERGDNVPEQAVIISLDLVGTSGEMLQKLRRAVGAAVPEFDPSKLIICATHTHTAPCFRPDWYPTPEQGVTRPEEYVEFLVEQASQAAREAWQNRRTGAVSWALGHAAVGFNRRVLYRDGSADMYGRTDRPDFLSVEGGQDPGVEMLFTRDESGELTGAIINIACPSQVVEGQNYVSADFWSSVRRRLKESYGDHMQVCAFTGAAGDQSPRDLVRRGRGEPDMRAEEGLEEMGSRISRAVHQAFQSAQGTFRENVPFRHHVEELELPARRVTEQEAAEAGSLAERLSDEQPDPASSEGMLLRRARRVVRQYEQQDPDQRFTMELHVLRIGDVALATNPFELFLDFGLRIKARSRALQTFIAQLACGWGGYLPTSKAVAGGGYGARIDNGPVGPEGGDVLVDRTVELINQMWDQS